MKNRPPVLAAALALLALSVPPARAAGPPPGYVSEVLPNGMRVSLLSDPTMPVVATQVWYHVGSANEEPRTRGFAHLFEHLMFSGTETNPGRAVWDHHERHGGDNNAFTSFDETVYLSDIPPAGHLRVLELEADRMVNLALTEEALANEKRIVTEELRVSNENSPFSRLLTKGLKAVLGEHPYALTPTGTKEDVAAATLEHGRDFYARYYRPRNAHLVVVGPVDAAATLAAVRRTFGSLDASGETPSDVPSLAAWTFPEHVALSEDLPPVEIAAAGFPLPPQDHPDQPALTVLQALLGWGDVDPVEEDLVRTRGKALFAGVDSMEARRGGAIALYAVNLPYRRQKTAFRHLEETRTTLGRYGWLTEEKLAGAKRRLELDLLDDRYYASSLASRIGEAAWHQGDEGRAFDQAERIAAVTLEDVRRVFRTYVLEREPVRVHVTPTRVPLLVRAFGWLYPVVR